MNNQHNTETEAVTHEQVVKACKDAGFGEILPDDYSDSEPVVIQAGNVAEEAKGLVSRTDETRIDWQDQSRGWLMTVGHIGPRPVCISLSISTLNSRPVLFYEATSEVVDHAQIKAWLKKNCWPKWDNGTRRAHCDAMNFHHCVEVCRAIAAITARDKGVE